MNESDSGRDHDLRNTKRRIFTGINAKLRPKACLRPEDCSGRMKVVCQHPRFRPQVVTHRRYSSLPRCGDQMLSWHDPSHTTPLVCHERSFPRKPSNFPQPQPDSRHPTMLMRRAAARAEAAEPMGAVRDRHQPHTVAVQTAPHTHSKRARGEAAMTPCRFGTRCLFRATETFVSR